MSAYLSGTFCVRSLDCTRWSSNENPPWCSKADCPGKRHVAARDPPSEQQSAPADYTRFIFVNDCELLTIVKMRMKEIEKSFDDRAMACVKRTAPERRSRAWFMRRYLSHFNAAATEYVRRVAELDGTDEYADDKEATKP